MSWNHSATSGVIVTYSQQKFINEKNMSVWFDALDLLVNNVTEKGFYDEYLDTVNESGLISGINWRDFDAKMESFLKDHPLNDPDPRVTHFNLFLVFILGEFAPEIYEFRVFEDGEYGYFDEVSSNTPCFIFETDTVFKRELTATGEKLQSLLGCHLEESIWSRFS